MYQVTMYKNVSSLDFVARDFQDPYVYLAMYVMDQITNLIRVFPSTDLLSIFTAAFTWCWLCEV
jgi:hypothetical protein